MREMVAACEGWWLRARNGGCVRGMVAACERWWLRARDDGCVRGMAAACEGWHMRLKGWRMRWKRAERYKLSRRRSAPGFVSKFTAHFHKTMQKACV